jgi:hypothetical protein
VQPAQRQAAGKGSRGGNGGKAAAAAAAGAESPAVKQPQTKRARRAVLS